VTPLAWQGGPADGRLWMLDQRALPLAERWIPLDTADEVATAITDMVVRGAPAIGWAAAWGAFLEARRLGDQASAAALAPALARLRAARPTAVNLMWAIDRLQALAARSAPSELADRFFEEARAIGAMDRAANRAMGDAGAAEVEGDGLHVLTICNTGSLATSGWGTAAGVIRSLHAQGRLACAWACETRPWLQGARLTAWELQRDGVPVRLLTDGMVGHLMKTRRIAAVFVGADRIARNGDSANKIGTYQLAVLAHHHGVPFHVVAPTTTVDLATPHGDAIPIEERSPDEVTAVQGVQIAPEGTPAWHPAFDVTPAALIRSIVTEQGAARPAYEASLAAAVQAGVATHSAR
jgi:methylthioribose-1-phosphate isomerase